MSWRCRFMLPVLSLTLAVLFPPSVLGGDVQFPCLTCHADKVRDKLSRNVHMSEAADNCVSCHPLAQGLRHPRDKASVTVPPQKSGSLCYRCHEREAANFVHAPFAAGECTACHAPHRAPAAGLLKKKGASLCFTCHKEQSFDPLFTHGPVIGGNCLFCHEPHRSDQRKLLRKFGAGLCLDCHGNSLAEGVSVHEPVGFGDCAGCHDIHGSASRKILKGQFAEDLYMPYNRSNFALCFLCHPHELAESPVTALTGFRNGNDNLHYLHINKGDRGRSCKACHDPHSARQEKLVLDKVPGFGSWDIPIFFTTTTTGGTCVVGCHKPKDYDRLQPVSY